MRGFGWSYAFRSMFGPWAVLPAVGLIIMNFSVRHDLWRGDAIVTAGGQAITITITGILVMASIAVDVARERSPGRVHHAALARPNRHPFVYALLAGSLPSMAAVGVAGIGSLLYASAFYLNVRNTLWALAAVCLLMLGVLALGAVGVLLGQLVGVSLAGVVAVLAGVTLFLAPTFFYGAGFRLLDFGVANGPMVGLRPNGFGMATRFVILTAVIMACVWLPIALQRSGEWGRWRSLIPAAVAVTLVLPLPFLPGRAT